MTIKNRRLDRNRLGQFATPGDLARDILQFAGKLCTNEADIRFLDPAFGTGSFYSALLDTFPAARIATASGFEVDPHYGKPANLLWRDTGLALRLEDFTAADPPPTGGAANLIICNPPYVRHHHLTGARKKHLQAIVAGTNGLRLSGLAGLYCYFLLIADRWMAPGAVAGWLVPSEFMDVNYGGVLKRYLLEKVTLLRIHRFDSTDVQFDDALVSSAVVWFRNDPPLPQHKIEFSLGGSLNRPQTLSELSASEIQGELKWTRFPRNEGAPSTAAGSGDLLLSDLFDIKRGIATGNNKFFILDEERASHLGISRTFLRPILPSPRHVPEDVVESDGEGNPSVAPRLFVIDCHLPLSELELIDPALARYLADGQPTVAGAYLCKSRRLWYTQEVRSPAPILCTYMGRSGGGRNAFRFIRNKSNAIAANVYLMMYPKGILKKAVESNPFAMQTAVEFLNALPAINLTSEGRIYGGGLHKLEPRELAKVSVGELVSLLDCPYLPARWHQLPLAYLSHAPAEFTVSRWCGPE